MRYSPVVAFLLAGLLGWPAWLAADDGPQRPHIVFIMADDLGWADVGYHGSEIATPHIDRLAAEGIRLEQFYAQPLCSPTRSSLMTGRYPIRQGLQVGVIRPWAEYGLPLEERTLAQALKDAGYRTAIVGKWHLGLHDRAFLPLQRGFMHQYGHYCGALDYFTHERDGGLDWRRDGEPLREEGYTTNLIADEAVRLIHAHAEDGRLFLYVAFNAPHGPLQAPSEYIERYAHIERTKRRIFAAMVTCMDDAIGRILAALDKQGIREQTLVIFSSDNGGAERHGADNGLLRGMKGQLYEGGVRVPAVVCWPGRLKGEGIVSQPVHMVDWYPTLLELAEASGQQSPPFDGNNIWPTIATGRPSPHDVILHNVEPDGRGAIRQGRWKLVIDGDRRRRSKERDGPIVELFNIQADPREQHNLAERHPDRVRRLRARLEAYGRQAVPPRSSYGPNKPDGFVTPAIWGPTHGKPDD